MPYDLNPNRRPWNRRYPVWARIRDEVILEIGFGAAFRMFQMYGEWSAVAAVLRQSGRLNQRHTPAVPVTPQRRRIAEVGDLPTPPESSRKKQKMAPKPMEGVQQGGVFFKTGEVEEVHKGMLLRREIVCNMNRKPSHRGKHETIHVMKIGGQLNDQVTRSNGGSGIVKCAEGQQGVFNDPVCTKEFLLRDSAKASGGTPGLTLPDYSVFSLVTSQFTSGSALNSAITGNTNAPFNDRIKLWSVKKNYMLGNLQPFPVFLEILVLTSKRNYPFDALDCWNKCIQEDSNASYQYTGASIGDAQHIVPGYAAAAQQTTGAGATGGYPGLGTLGERPYSFRNFLKYFHIQHTEKIDIAPNANIFLNFVFRYHGKLLDRAYLANANTNQCIAGITAHIMFIWHGPIAIATAPGSGSVDNVSTVAANIYGIQEMTISVSPPPERDSNDTRWTVQRIETGAAAGSMVIASTTESTDNATHTTAQTVQATQPS